MKPSLTRCLRWWWRRPARTPSWIRFGTAVVLGTMVVNVTGCFLIGLIWIGQGTGYFPYPARSFMINQMPWVYWGALLAALWTAVDMVVPNTLL